MINFDVDGVGFKVWLESIMRCHSMTPYDLRIKTGISKRKLVKLAKGNLSDFKLSEIIQVMETLGFETQMSMSSKIKKHA